MITTGFNINDIVAFMTSPVAEFIDKVTEQDIFHDINLSVKDGIALAKGDFLTKEGQIKTKWITKTGSRIKMEMIKDLYYRLGLGVENDPNLDPETRALKQEQHTQVLEDVAEFENILEGADEFSNFASFLGMNQGIKTSKMELQKFEDKVKRYFTNRLEAYKGEFTEEQKALVDEIGDFDVKRWFADSAYRDKVAKVYNIIKKCINLFDAFTHIPQFDAIRQLYDSVSVVDNQSSIKAAAFNECITAFENSGIKYISEKYHNNVLKQIDNQIISKFIQESNFEIPVKKNWKFLDSIGALKPIAKSGSFVVKDRASIATFKYLMESTIIPQLKQGQVTSINAQGKVETNKFSNLQDNAFITSLKPATEQGDSFYKNQLNMLTISQSLDSQRKYQQMVAGLRSMNNIQVTPSLTLTDMFMLYNLIVHKNQYGASRMTSLFDPIVSSSKESLLSNYLKWLGELDYSGKPHLNTNEDAATSNALELNLQDILIQSAPVVKTINGQSDPYVKVLNDNVLELWKNTGGKGKYSKVSAWVSKEAGESNTAYLERLQNQSKYFTLGGSYSDLVERQLQIIENLSNPEKVISCLNDFVKQGLLLIKKVCE